MRFLPPAPTRPRCIRGFLILPLLVTVACGSPGSEERTNPTPGAAPAPTEEGFIPTADPDSDERPWASASVNHALEKSGIRGTGSERALSWLEWGVPLPKPAVGAVAVLDYGEGRGHVAFVVGTYDGKIVLLGGDQGNAMSLTAFAAEEISAYRWPAEHPIDESAYQLPEVQPAGAPDVRTSTTPVRPREAPGTHPPATALYSTPDRKQTLSIDVLEPDRIRFVLRDESCRRSITGVAHVVYDTDVQIDAEAGVGYAAREYFYWADREGAQGVAIRLSLQEPRRARALEWGTSSQCPISDHLMRAGQ